ncbi:MAG: nitrous oxide reductase accessory protein NosL [Terriglobia bacterium]
MKRHIPIIQSMVLCAAILMTACTPKSVDPVDIESSDMCANCRMAISEKRYAAEVIDLQGEAHKFDDVGCMRNFLNKKMATQDVVARFAVDFETSHWLKAEQAYFVQSTQFKTPMYGGIVALGDGNRADRLATQSQGKVMRFEELFGEGLLNKGQRSKVESQMSIWTVTKSSSTSPFLNSAVLIQTFDVRPLAFDLGFSGRWTTWTSTQS